MIGTMMNTRYFRAVIRSSFLLFLLVHCARTCAQHPTELPIDSIALRINGCWYATDGGTKGQYCFGGDGTLIITPHGTGRDKLERQWSVDVKGEVVVKSGKHEIVYLIEHLANDGFVLVNNKEDVRLEGHREKPKHW